ncbi:MAG: ABC transporter ATP-binding protein, partial [Vallitaleaceae bacterium]|nr:ABC transporter ATP-binding protein [Vallitaleaceae bacterium]
MLKIVKHLKPFILPLLLAIVLLYVQAMADLALPDYMSNIVNKGVQQSGIDHAVPEAVSKTEMDKLLLFLFSEDKSAVLDSYNLIESSTSTYGDLLKDYPNLNGEDVYVLKDLTASQIDSIDLVMAKALLSASGVDKMIADANGEEIDFNGTKIPAGTDLFAMLAQIPEEKRAEIVDASSAKFESMGDKMVIQVGANIVKTTYDTLGVDTGKLQRNYILNIGYIMLLITLLGAACSIAVGFIAAKIAAGLGRDLRK